jgi:hypothetical protein
MTIKIDDGKDVYETMFVVIQAVAIHADKSAAERYSERIGGEVIEVKRAVIGNQIYLVKSDAKW